MNTQQAAIAADLAAGSAAINLAVVRGASPGEIAAAAAQAANQAAKEPASNPKQTADATGGGVAKAAHQPQKADTDACRSPNSAARPAETAGGKATLQAAATNALPRMMLWLWLRTLPDR